MTSLQITYWAWYLEYGGTPVETPVIYHLGDRAIYEHAEKFGERQYRFESNNRNMMLRFAACFGMFSIMRDMHISPHNLPMKMYQLFHLFVPARAERGSNRAQAPQGVYHARYALALHGHARSAEVL